MLNVKRSDTFKWNLLWRETIKLGWNELTLSVKDAGWINWILCRVVLVARNAVCVHCCDWQRGNVPFCRLCWCVNQELIGCVTLSSMLTWQPLSLPHGVYFFSLNSWHLTSLCLLNVFIVPEVTELERAAPARRLAWIPLTLLNSASCLPGEERALPHALPSRPTHVVRQPAHERLHIPGERCPPAARVLARCAHVLSHTSNTVDWLSEKWLLWSSSALFDWLIGAEVSFASMIFFSFAERPRWILFILYLL